MSERQEQTFLWHQRANQQLFAELCNAFYERELNRLVSQIDDIELLKKRIASLSYYIKRAAEHICELNTPLDLDSQNGSWLSNQASKPFSQRASATETTAFYSKHSKMALVIPISVVHAGIEQVVLDSVDEIDYDNAKLHCNEQGWFAFDGLSESSTSVVQKRLLKPSKAVMSAGCCGHQWLNGKRTSSRLLSLREMLLATRINWRQFSALARPKK